MVSSRRTLGSSAKMKYFENSQDVSRLIQIHGRLTPPGPGRKFEVDIVNRSAIVFITACWEAYLEDVCREVSKLLLKGYKSPDDIPKTIRKSVSQSIWDKKNPFKLWSLAGDGWRKVMDERLENTLATFHTPTSKNIDSLFESTIGLGQISARWAWKKMSARKAREKLDRYIRMRGDIAHRTKSRRPVHKYHVEDFFAHIERLVTKTDWAIENHTLDQFMLHW